MVGGEMLKNASQQCQAAHEEVEAHVRPMGDSWPSDLAALTPINRKLAVSYWLRWSVWKGRVNRTPIGVHPASRCLSFQRACSSAIANRNGDQRTWPAPETPPIPLGSGVRRVSGLSPVARRGAAEYTGQ